MRKIRTRSFFVIPLVIAIVSQTFSVMASADSNPPVIDQSSLTPLDHGNTMFSSQPLMAKISDEGSGVNPASITFTLTDGGTSKTYPGTWDPSTGWTKTVPLPLASGKTYEATLQVADKAGNKQTQSWSFLAISPPVVELANASLDGQGTNLNILGAAPGTQKWSFDPWLTVESRRVRFSHGSKHAGWGTLSSSVPLAQAAVQVFLDGQSQNLPLAPYPADTVKVVYQQLVNTDTAGQPKGVLVASEAVRLSPLTLDLPVGTTSATLTMASVPSLAEIGGICANPKEGSPGCSPDPLRFFVPDDFAARLEERLGFPVGETLDNDSLNSSAVCEIPGPDLGGYTCDEIPFDWADTTGGTSVSLSDDSVSSAISLPFTFNWYGQDKSNVYIGSNGLLCFGTSDCTLYMPPAPPNIASPNDLLACFWEDLNPGTGGTIRYKTVGSSPNQIFVVEFNGVPHFPSTGANTFQLQLAENGEARCMLSSVTDDSDSISTAVGTEDSTGTLGVRYGYAEFSATQIGIRFALSGLTPPDPGLPPEPSAILGIMRLIPDAEDSGGIWKNVSALATAACGPYQGSDGDAVCYVDGVAYPANSNIVPPANFGFFCGSITFCTYRSDNDRLYDKRTCIDMDDGRDIPATFGFNGWYGAGSERCQQYTAIDTYGFMFNGFATGTPHHLFRTVWDAEWGFQDGPQDEIGVHWSTRGPGNSQRTGWSPAQPNEFAVFGNLPVEVEHGAYYNIFPQSYWTGEPSDSTWDAYYTCFYGAWPAEMRFSASAESWAYGAGSGQHPSSGRGYPQWKHLQCSGKSMYYRTEHAVVTAVMRQIDLHGTTRNDGNLVGTWGHMERSFNYSWFFVNTAAGCASAPPRCQPLGILFNLATSGGYEEATQTKSRTNAFTYR